MPFTLAHPAAVVPIATRFKKYTSFSALVVGSMAPDFGYWTMWDPVSEFAHSIPGIFLFSIPAGLLALLLFHELMKRPAVDLMPEWIGDRLRPLCAQPSPLRMNSLSKVLFSLGLGAFTHIVWDSCTQREGAIVLALPFLQYKPSLFGVPWTGIYNYVKAGTTMLGLALLIWWSWKWLQAHSPDNRGKDAPLSLPSKRRLTSALVEIPGFIGIGAGIISVHFEPTLGAVVTFGWAMIVFGSASFFLMLMGIGAVWRMREQ